MRKGEEINNNNSVGRISGNWRLYEVYVSERKMISALIKNVMKALFFLLFCMGHSEAQVPPDAHTLCTSCHIEDGSSALINGINETCIGCHPNSPERDHPIGQVVKDVPEKLPLDKEDKISCITCHEPHGKETEDKLLRMEFNSLCIVCHTK